VGDPGDRAQAVACHIKDLSHYGTAVRDLAVAPEYVYRWYQQRKLVPSNPAGFRSRKVEDPDVVNESGPIRVLIVDREDTRKIVNHEELLEQCNDDPGPWECRGYMFGSGFIKYAARSCLVHVVV
jgi:hypothetical protein